MSKKAKRYEEGGDIQSEQGANKNITDDVRMRALKAISEGGQKNEEAPALKKVAKPTPKAEVDTEGENKAESQRLFNKKPVDSTSKADSGSVAKAYQESARMQAAKAKAKADSDAEERGRESAAMAARKPSSATKADPASVAKAYRDAARMKATGSAYKKGGTVSSASRRGDGCAVRGKTKGRMV